MLLLKDKRAVVTGGTIGIGREIAQAFIEQGAHVSIWGTNEERAKETVALLEGYKVSAEQRCSYRLVDVSKKAAVEAAMQADLTEYGAVEILVNNAGITRDTLLMKMTEEDWDMVLDTNLKSVYNTCASVIRSMIKGRFGKIINITSIAGLVGNPGQTNYAAAKAGMIGFSKALALEVATRNICVNCIAPGVIKTKMTDVLTEVQMEAIMKNVPMNKIGQCRDIANAAVFLASSWSDYMTGQVLTVDGGMVR